MYDLGHLYGGLEVKYTIEGPDLALEAFVVSDGYEKSQVALLLHMPEATPRTAAMFGRYAAKTWDKQPRYACFTAEPGSIVIRWTGKAVDLSTQDDLARVMVGRLRSAHIPGEFGSFGRTWVVDTNAKVTADEE
jgi:hypothetical protein